MLYVLFYLLENISCGIFIIINKLVIFIKIYWHQKCHIIKFVSNLINNTFTDICIFTQNIKYININWIKYYPALFNRVSHHIYKKTDYSWRLATQFPYSNTKISTNRVAQFDCRDRSKNSGWNPIVTILIDNQSDCQVVWYHN